MRPFQTAFIVLMLTGLALASDLDEFKVKRQEVFEFTEKPAVTREGDKVTITFTSKAFCDVTVAVENAEGKIVRHLASGVLGPKAPEPFQKNSLVQTLAWDGKDDAGVYVDDKDALTVRVSLGLKPQFERTLFWSPQKRIGISYPVLRAAREGMYVAEGYAVDHLRLFDHQGNYLRTVYPFPADKVEKAVGLKTHTFVQNGQTLPLKRGYHQATLLTCGTNYKEGGWIPDSSEGYAVSALAASNDRLALVNRRLDRLASDGSSGGLPVDGPKTSLTVARDGCGWGHPEITFPPLSAALSPDAKWLYLAGYQFEISGGWGGRDWMNCVLRMPYAGNVEPTLFVGSVKPGAANSGTEDGQFRMAASVACDPQGRVYVADYMNDRIQVFDPDAKHLKNISVAKPACVAVHQKTGDIYVFSWMLVNRLIRTDQLRIESTMTHLGPFNNPVVKNKCPLPLPNYGVTISWNVTGGVQHRVELDSWADKPTIWTVNGKVADVMGHDDGSIDGIRVEFDAGHVHVYEEAEGKLIEKRKFGADVQKSIGRLIPPILWRQRLIVNPASGKLYVAEGDCGVMKAFNQLVEIDPVKPKPRLVDLPMGCEDMCFDKDGLAYLRTDTVVARYEPKTWREIPWDYGEEFENHSFGMGARSATLVSGLHNPGHRSFNFWHLGGMDVTLKGHLVLTTCNGTQMTNAPAWARGEAHFDYKGKPYVPPVYPGRMRWGEIHIFDKHGKPILDDVVPGMGHMNGIGADERDNLYMLVASRRLIDGKIFDPTLERDVSGTVFKVSAKKAKVLSAGGNIPVPLGDSARPGRPIELTGYVTGWVDGAEWFYGGVGFCVPGGCVCWNSRFDLDYFNRSFAPEPLIYSVAVLDSSGNLICRIGKYGNVDDGRPLVLDGGPAGPRSIGGDEVALFHACYVASDTDHRLFIADAGNARILSVKLEYHATERVALKNVADGRPSGRAR